MATSATTGQADCVSDEAPVQRTEPIHQLEVELPSGISPAEDESQYPDGRSIFLVFIAAGLALFLMGLDGQILATAIPAITEDFKTLQDIGWYNASLRLTLCCLIFSFGRIYTFFSIKRTFLTAITIFEIGSLLCGLSPSSLSLILGRAIQGVGCAGIVMGTYAMVNSIVPKRKRPFMLGSLGAIEMSSQALAPLIGGVLVTKLNWRWCFYINLPLGAISIIIITKFYHDHKIPPHSDVSLIGKLKRLDPIGTLLLLPGLLSLLLALQYGGSIYSWSDPRVIACFVTAALLVGLFTWWQILRQDDAMLPPRVLSKRVIMAGMLFLACNNGTISIIQYYIPTYFQIIQQLSAQTSGYLVLPFLVPFVIALALSGTIASMTGYYFPLMIFTAITTPIASGLLSSLTVQSSLLRISGYQALLGLGSGLGFQGPQYAIQALLPQSDLEYGVACLQFGQKFGPAIVIPAAQALFLNSLTTALQHDAPSVNASIVQTMGLSEMKSQLQATQFQETLVGFDAALMQTFYLPTALASVIVFGVLTTKSTRLKKW